MEFIAYENNDNPRIEMIDFSEKNNTKTVYL